MASEIVIDWEPQPRQLVALKACGLDAPFTGAELRPAIADIFGYGGAAGGGKTDTLLSIGIVGALSYPTINIGYFRRKFPQLEGPGGAILRSQELISHVGEWKEQKHRWIFPTKSLMQFCHCQNPTDVYNYQSQQFDILLIDEATQFTEEMIDYLITRNRKTIDDPRFIPFTIMATNPGNVGHVSFKDRFITIGTPEEVHEFKYPTGVMRKHYFIPSKLADNEILQKRDPTYKDRISTSEMTRKMLLEGEWDVYAGQAFGELRREVHILQPFEIQKHWKRFGAYDHGYNHPFSFGVYTVDEDGLVYKIAQAKDRLKRVDEIARMMEQVSGGTEKLDYIVAGHDCWSVQRDGGPTIAEQFRNLAKPIYMRQANIDRIQGANQMRKYFAWKGTVVHPDGTVADGKPRFYFFANCYSSYDCISQMLFDDSRPEDVFKVDADENGKGGDDEYDETRYALMSRPAPAILPAKKPDINSGEALLKEIQDRNSLINSIKTWR